MAGNWSRVLGSDRSPGLLPCSLLGLSSSSLFLHPGIVSDIPGRLSSGSSLAARGRGDACQRSLRNRPRSVSRLLQSPFPGGEGFWQLETCGRSLAPEQVVQLTPFKMEAVASVLLSVREGDFLASLDLKNAYFQIPIHPSSRKLLRFTSEGTVYQFRALCFGLSTAPQVFTRVFAAVSAWAHTHRIRLLRYLDDWLVLSSLEREAKQAVQSLLLICHILGIVINEKKSDLVPSQTGKYLDMTIDTEAGKVFLSGMSREIPDGSGELLHHGRSPGSALAGDPRSPGFARAAGPSRSPGFARAAGPSRSPSDAHSPVASEGALVPRGVRPSLSTGVFASGSEMGPVLVVGEGPSVDGASIWATCSGSSPVFGCVFFGLGAHLLDQLVSGVWSDQEMSLHINLLEMKALFLGIQAFREDVTSHHVTAMCDNSTVLAYVNKQGGTVSRALCLLTSCLLRWTESFDIHLDARYLPGQANVLADLLSRCGQVVETEWSLHPQAARSLLRVWGNPSIDLFATSLNAKLTLYCSLVPDPQAVFEDAFRHPWDDLDLYAFPPFPLVSRVIARVRESSRVAMTLVAPLWPEKEWFADLLLLLAQPPLALPWWDSLLRQPHCNLFHQGVHTLNLHEWRLSSVTSKSRAFQEGLLEFCQGASDPPPHASTSRGGRSPVLVSWRGRCSSQRHCSSSRGLSDTLTPRQRLVRLCC